MMTTKPEQVSELKTSSDVISKFAIDANNGQSCSASTVYYRIVRPAIAAGTNTYAGLIPLKAPCTYNMTILWAGTSTNGPSAFAQHVIQQVNQTAPGAAIGQQTMASGSSPLGGGTFQIVIAKNATADSLDFTFFTSGIGGTITDAIEIVVVASRNF